MIARCTRDTSCDTSYPSPTLCSYTTDTNDPHYNDLAGGDVGREQLLIFTKGSRTYTPHQIGIKRMPCSVTELMARQHAHEADIETQDFGPNDDDAEDDNVDVTVELHGHIIGMNLSPDHRSAYLSLSLCNSLMMMM